MFSGKFQHALDNKGRLTLPARFRKAFSEGLWVTPGLDDCLAVYTPVGFTAQADDLAQHPTKRPDARAFGRLFFSGAHEDKLDGQGRIVIPATLREHANLERDVMVIGVSDHIEVWDLEAWMTYFGQYQAAYTDLAERLEEPGGRP